MAVIATNITGLPVTRGVYPTSDSFDTLTTTLDSTYLLGNYARFELFTLNSGNGIRALDGITTIYSNTRTLADSSADISNRYFPVDASQQFYRDNFASAICTHQTTGQGALGTGFVYRDIEMADVDLSMSSRFSDQPNGTNGVRGFIFGLAARMSGTVGGSGTTASRLQSVSGYYMVFIATAAGGTSSPSIIRYLLVKVVSGACTTVAEYNPYPTFSPQWNGLFPDAKKSRKMRLTCRTVSGNVELKGYLTSVVNGEEVESEILSYTDSTSPITAAGRAGFILAGENYSNSTVSGYPMAHMCDWWGIKAYGSSTYTLLEMWSRFWQRSGRQLTSVSAPIFHGLPGHSLMNGWVGDLWSHDSTGTNAYEISLRADTANNRIKVQPAVNSGVVYSWRSIKARDPKFQDRQVSVLFDNTSTTNLRGGGLTLFGSLAATNYQTALVGGVGSQPGGYMLRVEYDGTVPRWDVKLYRLRLAGTAGPTLMVSKTGYSGLSLGSAFTLRLVARALPIPNAQEPYISLKAYIGGVQVTWDVGAGVYDDGGVATGGSGSLTVASTGEVVDRKTNRIISGYGEGLVSYSSTATGASGLVFFDTFQNGAGAGQNDTPEQDQVTIAVPGENDAAVGTFSVPYEFGVVESESRGVFDHAFDSDHRYVAVKQSRARGRWRLGNESATASEASTLKSFYASHKGAEIPFSWTTPAGSAVTVRFVNDSLAVEQITPSVFRWSAEFEEVLSE
jgi:hypothetical protein